MNVKRKLSCNSELHFQSPFTFSAEDSCLTSFSDVFFIDASTAQTVNTSMANIALSNEIGETADDTVIWLTEKQDNWLLLFDNADDPQLSLSPFIPSCSHGNILITTRNNEMCVYAPGFNYNIGSLTPEDARDLLLRMIEQVITDETRSLVDVIAKVS